MCSGLLGGIRNISPSGWLAGRLGSAGALIDPFDIYGHRAEKDKEKAEAAYRETLRLQNEALANEKLRREEEDLRRENAVTRVNALYGLGDGLIKGGTDKLGTVKVLPETLDVAGYAAARQAGYDRVKQNSLGLLADEIARNRDDASRQVRFGLARTGLAGGSADISAHRDITDANQRSMLEANHYADRQAALMRGDDENTRADIISRIYAGLDGDSAAAAAAQRMSINRQAELNAPVSGALNNLFAGIGNAWSAYQYANGMANPHGNLHRVGGGSVGGYKGRIS